MTDYIELGPDDVIRAGDEYRKRNSRHDWAVVRHPEKTETASMWPGFQWRRPRSDAIRDAAIELLRWYLYAGASGITSAKFEKLKSAVGLTDEELRGEA